MRFRIGWNGVPLFEGRAAAIEEMEFHCRKNGFYERLLAFEQKNSDFANKSKGAKIL